MHGWYVCLVSVVIVKPILLCRQIKKSVIMLNLYMIWHIMYYYLFRLFMLRISLWHAFRIETEPHTRTALCVPVQCVVDLDADVLYTKSSIFSLSVCMMFFLHFPFPYFVNMCFLNYLIDITINVRISPRTMCHSLFIFLPWLHPPPVRQSLYRSFVHPCHPSNQLRRFKNCKGLRNRIIFVRSIWQVDKIGNERRLDAADRQKKLHNVNYRSELKMNINFWSNKFY